MPRENAADTVSRVTSPNRLGRAWCSDKRHRGVGRVAWAHRVIATGSWGVPELAYPLSAEITRVIRSAKEHADGVTPTHESGCRVYGGRSLFWRCCFTCSSKGRSWTLRVLSSYFSRLYPGWHRSFLGQNDRAAGNLSFKRFKPSSSGKRRRLMHSSSSSRIF